MIRVPSPLDEQTETYVKETMDCGFAVHKALGPGFPELTYRNAFCLEMTAQKIPFECEKPFVVKYRDRPVSTHRVDLVVRNRVIVVLFIRGLNLFPFRVHFLERRAVQRAAIRVEVGFELVEPLRELLVRFSQRRLRLDAQPS